MSLVCCVAECNVKLVKNNRSGAVLQPCECLVCFPCLATCLAHVVSTERKMKCPKCNARVFAHRPLGKDDETNDDQERVVKHRPPDFDVERYKQELRKYKPFDYIARVYPAEERKGKGALYYVKADEEIEDHYTTILALFDGKTCQMETFSDEVHLAAIATQLNPILFKKTPPKKYQADCIPSLAELAEECRHDTSLASTFLYALGTECVRDMNKDKTAWIPFPTNNEYWLNDWKACWVAKNSLHQCAANQVLNRRAPSPWAVVLGKTLDECGCKKQVITSLCTWRQSESLTLIRKKKNKKKLENKTT